MREFVVKDWKSSGPLRLMRDAQDGPEKPGQVQPSVRTFAISAAGKEKAEPVAPATPPSAPEPPTPELRSSAPPPAALPRPSSAAEPRRASPAKKQGERVFVVHYAGSYVGLYQAEDELKPQEAFLCVARELSSQGPFDPEKLTLYKPVLIKSARPPKGMHFVRGTLCKVAAPPPEVVATPAEPEPSSQPADLPVVCLDEST